MTRVCRVGRWDVTILLLVERGIVRLHISPYYIVQEVPVQLKECVEQMQGEVSSQFMRGKQTKNTVIHPECHAM